MQVRYRTVPWVGGRHVFLVQRSYWWLPFWIDVEGVFHDEESARVFAHRLKNPIIQKV